MENENGGLQETPELIEIYKRKARAMAAITVAKREWWFNGQKRIRRANNFIISLRKKYPEACGHRFLDFLADEENAQLKVAHQKISQESVTDVTK